MLKTLTRSSGSGARSRFSAYRPKRLMCSFGNRQSLWICTIVNRTQIERPRFGGKLFDLDIGLNLAKPEIPAK